jgi:hypothetical protein
MGQPSVVVHHEPDRHNHQDQEQIHIAISLAGLPLSFTSLGWAKSAALKRNRNYVLLLLRSRRSGEHYARHDCHHIFCDVVVMVPLPR